MTATRTDQDFQRLADPYRRELLAHCYRMLGSVHDAEDLVQETYLRAWRAYDKFEGRSSLRTWLHRIATTACLTALESRQRRPMPTGLGAPASAPEADLVERGEVPWLEPIPTTGEDVSDPAAVVTSRESVRLALVATMQHLPPRQRAVLILCEVLKWKAAEVADALDTSVASVNSLLQRARAQLGDVAPTEESVAESASLPATAEQRELLERYVAAFENYDFPSLVHLFTSDAVWEMPPFDGWYQGPENIVTLFLKQCPAKAPDDLRLVPTEANGQPAYALYLRDPEDGVHRQFALQVITLSGNAVSHVGMFFEPALFATFGLPAELS